MGAAFLCVLGFIFFYLMDTELGKQIIPLPTDLTNIISDTGSLSTLIVWGYIFLSIDTFTEFGWNFPGIFIAIVIFSHRIGIIGSKSRIRSFT